MAIHFNPNEQLKIVIDTQNRTYTVKQEGDTKSPFLAPLMIASSAEQLSQRSAEPAPLQIQAQPQRESSFQKAFSLIQTASLIATVSYLTAGWAGVAGVSALSLAYIARRPLTTLASYTGNLLAHSASAGIKLGHRIFNALGVIPEYAGKTIAGIGTGIAQASATYPAVAGALMTVATAGAYYLRDQADPTD